MSHVVGQLFFTLLVFIATAAGIRCILHHGNRPQQVEGRAMRLPARQAEARVLAVIVAAVATGVVAAVLLTWPVG